MQRIYIFDTTLRDGEQSPGASMSIKDKCLIAEKLEDMGVDVIEAGFPVASNGDFEAVNQVAKLLKTAQVAGLARAKKRDIEVAYEALKPAKRPRIHTFISTSPLHMKYKLQMEPEAVHQAIIDSVGWARALCEDIEWSCEDGTRTEDDFLCRCVESAIKAGARTINFPDTVGYSVPGELAKKVEMLINRVPNIDKAIISVHCHNDLGLAVANSLSAVYSGARQVECTINGIGERAGNAALEEIVMTLKTRPDAYPYTTNIDSTKIMGLSKLVSKITGFDVQKNKAIVGANAFAHESGIHQDGMLKHAQTYEIMTPESVGLTRSSLVLGKHSGRHAFRKRLEELGFSSAEEEIDTAFQKFKDLADRKKHVYDEDIISLFRDVATQDTREKIKLLSVRGTFGSTGFETAVVELELDGEHKKQSGAGDGAIDAALDAVRKLIPLDFEVRNFSVKALTHEADAQAEASITLAVGEYCALGRAVNTDTVVASVSAHIAALNKIYHLLEKNCT